MQALRTAFIISPNMARRIVSMAARLTEIADQLDGVATKRRRRTKRTPKPIAAAATSPVKPKRSLAKVPDQP